MQTHTCKPKERIRIILIQLVILLITIYLRLPDNSFFIKPESLVYPLCCLLCGLMVWYFWSWYFLTKSLFHPYLLFMLSAFLFNGGQAFLRALNLNEDEILNVFEFSFSADTRNDTLFIVIIGLSSFHLGALISLNQKKAKYYKSKIEENELLTYKSTHKVGTYLLRISFFPAVYVFGTSILTVLSSGYSGLYENWGSGISGTPDILAAFLVPASLFLLAASKENLKSRRISATIILIYVMTRLFTGQRNQAVMVLTSFAWLWHHLIRPIPGTLILIFGSLITFVISPLIAVTRNSSSEDRLSINYLIESFSNIENPLIAPIWEMGGSMLTIAHTLELVPTYRDFQWGQDYLYALLTLVPNLWGARHPTIARGLAEKWLVQEVNPYFAYNGGTYGFTFIAEAYLNFGWIGAPIALGIIGFLFAKLTSWAVTYKDPAKMAMIASYLSFFLFYARAESAFIIRSLVWYSILPYLWVLAVKKSMSKKMNKANLKTI
jgi:oligosaccharide repeat unit polymerase